MTRTPAELDAFLSRLAAAPKTHRCVVLYADGRERHVDQPSELQAVRVAEMEARKLGRDLISRDTGATVRVVSVHVEALARESR